MMTDGNEMSADAYEPYDFANRRHIGPSPEEIAEMLQVVGVSSLDALMDETVPKDIRLRNAAEAVRALRNARAQTYTRCATRRIELGRPGVRVKVLGAVPEAATRRGRAHSSEAIAPIT
jgi:Glycine cleavage system P-protein